MDTNTDRISTDKIKAAADRLHEAARSGLPCAPVRDLIDPADIAGAYAVQEINTRRGLQSGRRLVGRKIGLTARAVQRQLGVDQPDYGMLFADMALGDGEEVPAGAVMQPKVEAEIAFVLGRDLAHESLTIIDLMRAVDCALPSVEVVGSRIANWDIRLSDTIADNASSGMFVLGSCPRTLDRLDLRLCGAVIEHRGEPVSVGAGAACMGNPLNAALWLARVMVRAGRPLQAGDVILSGALGPMVSASPGDVFEVRINGLGALRAAFGKE
jgi:2-keto-4-pentenoate hydratase